MKNKFVENLIFKIIENSYSKTWKEAVKEWKIVDLEIIDKDSYTECICGKENIKYLYSIKNYNNGNIIYPIGSSCIKKFNRRDLNEEIDINMKMGELLIAYKNNQFIELNSKYFSKKLLLYLFENNVFESNIYNSFNPELDYKFLLKMFNKRNKPTENEEKKIRALIVKSIIPFLEEKIKTKNIQRG